MTEEGQNVEKSGMEFPQGLKQTEAVGLMESRQFTHGIRLLDFLFNALTARSLSRKKQGILAGITMERLHVSSSCNPFLELAQNLKSMPACDMLLGVRLSLLSHSAVLQSSDRLSYWHI